MAWIKNNTRIEYIYRVNVILQLNGNGNFKIGENLQEQRITKWQIKKREWEKFGGENESITSNCSSNEMFK